MATSGVEIGLNKNDDQLMMMLIKNDSADIDVDNDYSGDHDVYNDDHDVDNDDHDVDNDDHDVDNDDHDFDNDYSGDHDVDNYDL